MPQIMYYSTNNKQEKVDFQTALLNGMASNYGLYMMSQDSIPKISQEQIKKMCTKSYADIAFQVLHPFLKDEIEDDSLEKLLHDAYDEIAPKIQKVTNQVSIMWLTKGPTYSFKDYAARFFGRALNHFLTQLDQKRVVIVATSGDTGGAVADALYELDRMDNIVFFPLDGISEGQRRQMTTLGKNVYAFAVNGDFDVCQELAKYLLGDKDFANEVFNDEERFTSANSISVGRLLPQAVYPFFAYSRIAESGDEMVASIPSGNFGDMMGTVIAKEMGLPLEKIVCGVNENTEFPDFLETGKYVIKPTKVSPSSAMNVSHPSNLARLIDFYGGHMYDKRDKNGNAIEKGIITKMPNMEEMKKDILSVAINNQSHYAIIKEVYDEFGIILDPHGAVSWDALDIYLQAKRIMIGEPYRTPSVVYETADPGKFPDDIQKAIRVEPKLPPRMKAQANQKERIYTIDSVPNETDEGKKQLSKEQILEAKEKIRDIYKFLIK